MDYYYYDSSEDSSEDYEEDIPLSGKQVIDIVGHEIGGFLFSQVRDVDLEDMFVNDCCLINYHNTYNSGHWCCMIRNGNDIIYFNPSGRYIDETIDYMSDYKYESDQYYPHLLKKLSESDYNIRYMDVQLQEYNTNTCGRYCALFMRYRKLGEDDFIKIFKNISNEDIIKYTDKFMMSY